MYGPRFNIASVFVVVAAAAMVAGTLGLWLVAPLLASTPKDEIRTVYPEPSTPSRVVPLAPLVDDLPIIARSLPDQQSRRAVVAYDRARLMDSTTMASALESAKNGLAAAAGNRPEVTTLIHLLVSSEASPLLSVDDPPFDEPDYQRTMSAAWPVLRTDPMNQDRLSNLAVFMFLTGVAEDYGGTVPLPGGARLASPNGLEIHAVRLLRETERNLGGTRALRLNLAYLRGSQHGCKGPALDIADAARAARRQVDADPSDRLARLLAASLTSKADSGQSGLDAALALVAPLMNAPSTAPLALVSMGDARLAVAGQRPYSPFGDRQLARQALADYDLALTESGDAAIYADRAQALAFLGANLEAVIAQLKATELAPGSVQLHLTLALDQGAAGDILGMRRTARATIPAAAAANPLFRQSPLATVTTFGGDSSPVGLLSILRPRDIAGVSDFTVGGCGAGGFVVIADLIHPAVGPGFGSGAWPMDVAASIAIGASALLHDRNGAASDAATWSGLVESNPTLSGNPQNLQTRARFIESSMVQASQLINGDNVKAQDLFTPLDLAEGLLHSYARFEEAYSMCSRIAAQQSKDSFIAPFASQCAGESAYLGRDYSNAKRVLDQLAASQRSGTDVGPYDFDAAAADWAAGDLEAARQIFLRAAKSPDLSLTSLAELGDLELDSGDYVQAQAYYDLTIVSLGDVPHFESTVDMGSILAATEIESAKVAERSYNNRGVARIRSAQSSPDIAPDCSTKNYCRMAQQDFAAALAIDPFNPIYLMNAAWAARLLGDPAIARSDLQQATQLDRSLYPAFNDLGVLAAEAGDDQTAEHDFHAALGANPSYDLAEWNLGVLSLRQGPSHLAEGEAQLGRAAQLNPGLRGQPIEFKTDEGIYKVRLGGLQAPPSTWTFSRSYGLTAAVLGSTTTLAAAGTALDDLTGKVADFIGELGRSFIPRITAFLGRRIPSRLRNRILGQAQLLGQWLLTLPVLFAVAAVTAWTANPEAKAAVIALAILATALAVLVHETGHVVAAVASRAQVAPRAWAPGIGLAILLLPFRLSSGPYVGHSVTGVSAAKAWWVYLAGPAANLIVALGASGLFLIRPLPILQLIAQIQLAALAFTLLPFGPLDGASIAKRRPLVAAAIGLAVAAAGIAIVFSTK